MVNRCQQDIDEKKVSRSVLCSSVSTRVSCLIVDCLKGDPGEKMTISGQTFGFEFLVNFCTLELPLSSGGQILPSNYFFMPARVKRNYAYNSTFFLGTPLRRAGLSSSLRALPVHFEGAGCLQGRFPWCLGYRKVLSVLPSSGCVGSSCYLHYRHS